MIVADAVLVECWRACRLDAPDEAFRDQHAEDIVHRLARNGAKMVARLLGNRVGGSVRLRSQRPKHGEPLRRDGDAMLPQQFGVIPHASETLEVLDPVKNLSASNRL